MRAYRIVGLFIATAVAVLIAPAVAHADPYPDQPPDSSVSDGAVPAGGSVTFSGVGFQPGETISIVVHYANSQEETFEVTASEDGTFSTSVTLSHTGAATLVATGLDSGVAVSSSVEVLAPEGNNGNNGDNENNGNNGDNGNSGDNSAGGGNMLPKTGGSGRTMLFEIAGGVGALVLGAVLLWLTTARRRRSSN